MSVKCALCEYADDLWIGDHILDTHGMSLDDYELTYGPFVDRAITNMIDHPVRKRAADIAKVDFAGIAVKVNTDVPADACLPLPGAYRIPEHGELAGDVQETVVALSKNRSVYVWGLPGAGKDALPHAWSALTRRPAAIFQIEPGEDLRAWFFSHEIGSEGSYWAEGELLKALRDGYVSPISGRRIPMLILITDFDRATGDQAESMRLIMDSISGRVKGAGGVKYPVLPGTQIFVTANSSGGGDTRGRCVTSKPIDASILDRFDRAFQFHWMSWQDEEPIVKEKFPILAIKAPNVFSQVGAAVEQIRKEIAAENLYAEFSHRAVCAWLGHTQDLLEAVGPSGKILSRSLRAVIDKMPDEETRDAARKLADPHLADIGRRNR